MLNNLKKLLVPAVFGISIINGYAQIISGEFTYQWMYNFGRATFTYDTDRCEGKLRGIVGKDIEGISFKNLGNCHGEIPFKVYSGAFPQDWGTEEAAFFLSTENPDRNQLCPKDWNELAFGNEERSKVWISSKDSVNDPEDVKYVILEGSFMEAIFLEGDDYVAHDDTRMMVIAAEQGDSQVGYWTPMVETTEKN